MKEFLETTPGKLLLGALVLLIWGRNVINISELSSSDEQVAVQSVKNIDIDNLVLPAKISYEYSSSGRDPFKKPFLRYELPTKPEQIQESKEEVVLPNITLSGIMEGMALITDEQGNTVFVKAKETFMNELYVMHIWQDSVLLEYQDKKFTLKLN